MKLISLKIFEFLRNINFWKTKSKAEADFIIQDQGSIVPIKVKYSKNHKIGKNLYSFIKKFKPKKAVVLTQNVTSEKKQKIAEFNLSLYISYKSNIFCGFSGGFSVSIKKIRQKHDLILFGVVAGLVVFLVQSFSDTNLFELQLSVVIWLFLGFGGLQ